MNVRLLLLSLVAVVVGGCATEYQARGFTGGFTETQVAENVWTIRFAGNGYTGAGQVRDFALLRASEVTLQNGYRYFVVQEQENSAQTDVGSLAGNAYVAPQVYSVHKAGAERTIVCYKEKPQAASIVYDAEFLSKSLREKYDIK